MGLWDIGYPGKEIYGLNHCKGVRDFPVVVRWIYADFINGALKAGYAVLSDWVIDFYR